MTEIFAGQIWTQKELPCCLHYVVLTPNGFCLLSDPRERGNMAYEEIEGKWLYTKEELATKFRELNYSCDGQLHDILQSKFEKLLYTRVESKAGVK